VVLCGIGQEDWIVKMRAKKNSYPCPKCQHVTEHIDYKCVKCDVVSKKTKTKKELLTLDKK
jgi:hypothetical protein